MRIHHGQRLIEQAAILLPYMEDGRLLVTVLPVDGDLRSDTAAGPRHHPRGLPVDDLIQLLAMAQAPSPPLLALEAKIEVVVVTLDRVNPLT